MLTFQQILRKLSEFWEKEGCVIHQGYDLELGAGTSNPATFLRSLGPEPYRAAYVEPCRRPSDGRYALNPIRFQHYFQYQVILKPSPLHIVDLYLKSLEAIGFNLNEHDIRFVHDDWENPTLGAWGLGWEVWMDGMEVTQFTYFQAVAGQELKPITGEITYGIERLATFLQNVPSTFDLKWNEHLTYGDIYRQNEVEWSHYNFEKASVPLWHKIFEEAEAEAKWILKEGFPLPAYDMALKASHAFNMLDARGAISVTERASYMGRIRDLAKKVAEGYIESREKQGFPLKGKFPPVHTGVATPGKIPHITHTDDFLLEVGVEELPATFVPIGMTQLEKGIKGLLDKQGIGYTSLHPMGTPRRLSLLVKGLQPHVAAKSVEKRGPALTSAFDAEGKPTPAGMGFLKTVGAEKATRDSLPQNVEVREGYLFAIQQTESQSTAKILSHALPDLLLKMEFPKTMRWADLEFSFPRPIRWLTALYGTEVIPFAIGPYLSDRKTYGHRQLHPEEVSLKSAHEYVETLRKKKVLVDVEERKKAIEEALDPHALAKEEVIPQVLHLVEWPHLAQAQFDEAFLRAPSEILIAEMVQHQKYFPIANGSKLDNAFIITANIPPTPAILAGNQKVLGARLTDGCFLYDQDLAVPLETFNDKLKSVTYIKGLGSVYDKVVRLGQHVKILHKALKIGQMGRLERAAHFAKADLASGVVYEFPELQGTMGKIYAAHAGEDPEVALAIEEHYLPRGEGDELPYTETGTLLSLADKIDHLLACFAAGFKPSSSSDPFALRRAVLGIVRIVVKGKYHLPLRDILTQSAAIVPNAKAEHVEEICQFITNRIKTVFTEEGFSKDEIEASLSAGFEDIYDTFLRVQALHAFRKEPKFALLWEVYKRAKGQLDHSQKWNFHKEKLQEPAEQLLHTSLMEMEERFNRALDKKHYEEAYRMIAEVQPPLALLFDKVKILSDDPTLKENRLALLQKVFGLFGRLIDFSKLH